MRTVIMIYASFGGVENVKTGFIRYLLAIIFMSAALSVFDMITALLFKILFFCVENYAQRNMFAGLLKEVLLCAG